jgi:hypothetical protein
MWQKDGWQKNEQQGTKKATWDETVWDVSRVSMFLIFIAGVYDWQRDIFGPILKKIVK